MSRLIYPSSKTLSFVLQGPVVRDVNQGDPTCQALTAIRRHYPGAEVILSTWKGANVEGLDYDQLVTSDDPGPLRWNVPEFGLYRENNIRRQIVSTKAGLAAATRRWAVKLRSDIVFEGAAWLDAYRIFPLRSLTWKLSQERIVVCSIYTRDPKGWYHHPLHPSDWITCGLTSDLRQLWDCKVLGDPEVVNGSDEYWRLMSTPGIAWYKYCPEQLIWYNYLLKHGAVSLKNSVDCSPDNLRLTRTTFANNLIVLDPEQFPLRLQKFNVDFETRVSCIGHSEWRRSYMRDCLPFGLVRSACDAVGDGYYWRKTIRLLPHRLKVRLTGVTLNGISVRRLAEKSGSA